MRYLHVGAGFVGAVLLAVSSSVAQAEPSGNATTKPLGEYPIRAKTNAATQNQTYRAYSYAPQTTKAPVAAAEPTKADKTINNDTTTKNDTATTQVQSNPVRSYSYQTLPTTQFNTRRRGTDSRYLHAERKELGQY
jgi:hypothetical protein